MNIARVRPTRVYRFYRGGALIDRLRGEPERDGDHPEDWVSAYAEGYERFTRLYPTLRSL